MAALASALLQCLTALPALLLRLDRLVTARERQAAALERLAEAADAYVKLDPQYWASLEVVRGTRSADALEGEAEAEVQSPAERAASVERLTTFQALWWRDRGEWLDGDRLVETFEREWQAALDRQDGEGAGGAGGAEVAGGTGRLGGRR